MKSEPDVYSITRLEKEKTTWWEGVRNYQARNFMMKEMKLGDVVLFYHSNAEPPGIAGLAKVSKLAAADEAQFDKKSEYYDPKATREKPIWYCVQVAFTEKFSKLLPLNEIRTEPALAEMLLLKRGQRLSIQPVEEKHFSYIVKWAQKKS